MKRSRETEKQWEQEPANWVLCRLAESGPFVVLFSIPQQTTTGHIKHSGTKSQARAGVCVRWSLFQQGMFTHPCLLHPTALSLCTAWSGFMDALRAFAILVHFSSHPLTTTYFISAADSWHSLYRRWSQRSHRTASTQAEENQKENLSRRKAHSQETHDNKPSIVLNQCVFFILHVFECVCGCITAPPARYSCLQV